MTAVLMAALVLGSGLPPAEEPSAVVKGTATWYCSQTSICTRGSGPGDMVAAIDPKLRIPKGTWLKVSLVGTNRFVNVRIVDVCACAGRRIIDLTSGAFRRLAPLSRGVIEVTIAPLEVRLPATDTIASTHSPNRIPWRNL